MSRVWRPHKKVQCTKCGWKGKRAIDNLEWCGKCYTKSLVVTGDVKNDYSPMAKMWMKVIKINEEKQKDRKTKIP